MNLNEKEFEVITNIIKYYILLAFDLVAESFN